MKPRTRFGNEEISLLAEALLTQDLWPYKYAPGQIGYIDRARRAIEDYYGSVGIGQPPYMVPTASGTSSIQVALGGLQIPVGSEIIVTPITDIGTVNPILFHNAIPVFADVDPASGLITPETVMAVVDKERTSAVIAVHLTGSPVDVPGIRAALDAEGLTEVRIIEDVAQGLGASLNGVPLGMLGDAGCFSLNSHKHISAGEGGFVLLRDQTDFLRCHSFSDKHRNRLGADEDSEHGKFKGLGHSLRMSELQGAMVLAQLPKLAGFAKARNIFGLALDLRLSALGLIPQTHLAGAYPSFFFYMFASENEYDHDLRRKVANEISGEIRKETGLRASTSYSFLDEPIYRYDAFQTQNFCDDPRYWPGALAANARYGPKNYDYNSVSCPNAESYLRRSFSIYLDERQGFPEATVAVNAIEKVFKANGIE